MSVSIRLKREGRKNLPSYRIHVTETRSARDGRSLENLGYYDPRAATPEKRLAIDKDRAQHWMKQGAILSDTIASLFRQAKVIEGITAKPARDRDYEEHNTYSNLLSQRFPVFNLLVLNFCYHNVHHHKPSGQAH